MHAGIKPDFFVVGAPKCGTTAICAYLGQHPEVFIPRIKEINFFGSDLTGLRSARNLSEYLAFFEPGDGKCCGEGSTWYLFSKTAASEIHRHNPSAKIIIMLRDPVEAMYSLHNQLLYNGNEDIRDFGQALAAEEDRKNGLRIPPGCRRPEALLYSQAFRFTEQVERYFSLFNREKVHVIIYDDFRADPVSSYHKTVEFLGLLSAGDPDAKVVNPSKYARNRALRSLYQNPSPATQAIARILLPQGLRQKLRQGIMRLNTREAPRPSMDPALRTSLKENLAEEVRALSKLLGRDLSIWSRP